MRKEITQFVGAHHFLSNFYMYPVSYAGWVWPSVEHAYQAAKTDNEVSKSIIRKAKTAAQAKAIGQGVRLIPDWDNRRVQIMGDILRCKFLRSGRMAHLLLLTDGANLIHGNCHGDRFWGCVRVGTEWQGQNHLGLLLMEIRKELQQRDQPTLFEPKKPSRTQLQDDDECPV